VSKRLERLIDYTVKVINRVGLEKYREKYSPGEDRSLLFVVMSPRGQYGFVMRGDRVEVLKELDFEPTFVVTTDEETVWAIAAGKMDLTYATATERVRWSGEYALRDYIILRTLFHELFREVFG